MMQAAAAVSRRSSRVPPCCRIGVARISQRCSRIGNEGGEAQLSLSAGGGTGTNDAQAPRRRTARARGEPTGVAHVPPWLPPYARRSGRRCRGRGDESRTETIGWRGALLML